MLEVNLLGQFAVRLDGAPVHLTSHAVQKALAYLLLKRDVAHRREQLAGLLWPYSSENNARKNLRNAVWALRQTISESYLLADRSSLAFNIFAPYRLDVALLEDEGMVADIERLSRALAVYRGELLPGFYDDWVLRERDRLRILFEQRMQMLLDRLAAEGRWTDVVTWAERWLALGEVPEPAFRALMTAHAARGDLATMTTVYRRCVQVLDEELAVPPSRETEMLYQRLLQGEVPFAPQSDRVNRAPIMPAPVATISPSALSSVSTPFIGREKELSELCDLLRSDHGSRLITLLGPGGIGKTRLALEVTSAAQGAFAQGFCLVSLAPVDAAEQIVSAITAALGLRFYTPVEPRQQLLDYLREKELLLLLDNFEHLLDSSELVAELLRVAPRLKILTTSRERLNIEEEIVYAVQGMSFPPAAGATGLQEEDVSEYSAVQLFVEVAYRIRPDMQFEPADYQAIGHICRLVQGMPLAVVLAAGWLEVLAPQEIAAEIAQSLDFLESEMRDLPARQRSVRATFDYSWQHLPDRDQETFMKLALFRGGFTRQAAQAVAGAGLRTLRRLVDKSFISVVRNGRYEIHELLRQYGLDRLKASGSPEATYRAHSAFFLSLLEQLEGDLKGRRQLEALGEIEADLENVRAACFWAIEHGEARSVGRAAEALHLFFDLRTRFLDGSRLFQQICGRLAEESDPENEWAWGRAAARLCYLRSRQYLQEAQDRANVEMATEIAARQENRTEMAFCTLAHACYEASVAEIVSGSARDFAQALALFNESFERYQQLNDAFYVARAARGLGICYGYEASTMEAYQKSFGIYLELARAVGSQVDEVHALNSLGHGAIDLGTYAEAKRYCREAVAAGGRVGVHDRVALANGGLALVHFLEGHVERARALAQEGEAMARQIHAGGAVTVALGVLGLVEAVSGQYALAQQIGEESREATAHRYYLSYAHWCLAVASCGLAHDEAAWLHLDAAFRVLPTTARLVRLLPVAVVLLERQGRQERAAELLGLAFEHPLATRGWLNHWKLLGETGARLESELGMERYGNLRQRGATVDVKTALAELFAR